MVVLACLFGGNVTDNGNIRQELYKEDSQEATRGEASTSTATTARRLSAIPYTQSMTTDVLVASGHALILRKVMHSSSRLWCRGMALVSPPALDAKAVLIQCRSACCYAYQAMCAVFHG